MTTQTSVWAGRALSGLIVLFLVVDGATGLLAPGTMAAEFKQTGYSMAIGSAIGIIPIVCALVYAIPRTAALGAVLITGFLGGAIATHVRIGDALAPPVFVSLVLGALAWLGLWLRDARVRALLPVSS
jgi:hypothetical protein